MTAELQSVISKSRDLALRNDTGFINYDHLFVAMLHVDCFARQFLLRTNIEEWTRSIESKYEIDKTLDKKADLPITVTAERVLKHCSSIAKAGKKKDADSNDLLLAILSYENPVAQGLQKEGVIFEDISRKLFKIPLSKTSPEIELKRMHPYSPFERFFISKRGREKKLSDLHHQAYALFEYEKFDECIKTCNAGLSLSPSYDAFKYLIAYSYAKKREFSIALDHFTTLSVADPANTDLLLNLAWIYDQAGDYSKAEELLNKLELSLPGNHTVLNNKGFNLCLQGKYAEAILYFEKCIVSTPDFAYPWNNLGFAKFKLGSIEEALQLIDKSLTLDAGNSYAYKNKGIILMETGDKNNALENFNLALKFGYTKRYGNEVVELINKLVLTPNS